MLCFRPRQCPCVHPRREDVLQELAEAERGEDLRDDDEEVEDAM